MCGFADRGYEEPGRSEDLPHTATIKRHTGADATVSGLVGCKVTTRIYRAAKPNRQFKSATGAH